MGVLACSQERWLMPGMNGLDARGGGLAEVKIMGFRGVLP